MGANRQPRATAGELPEEGQYLLTLLARVYDLGRGPPGLVWWVRRQLAASGAPTGGLAAAHRKSLLLRLARDLSRQLRSDELTATVAVKVSRTVRVRLLGTA